MNKRFVLYVKRKCPFCVKAATFLRDANIPFSTVAFDKRPLALSEMKEVYNWPTVPMVFEEMEEGTYKLVGGYTDLLQRLEDKG